MTLTAVASSEAATGLDVRRMVPAALASGGTVDVEIASASPLPDTPLSPEAQDRASFLASVISAYVGAKFESPDAGLIIGLVVYLVLNEYARLTRR